MNFNDVIFGFDGGVTAGVGWISKSSSDLLNSVNDIIELSSLDLSDCGFDSSLQGWSWLTTLDGIGDFFQDSGGEGEPSGEVLEVIGGSLNFKSLRSLVDNSDLSTEGWGADQCDQKGSHLF